MNTEEELFVQDTQKKEEPMSPHAPMYVYATEMVGSYYPIVEVAGKSLLTITGSGDQVINACYLGAREVTGFDLNAHAVLFAELKITLLQKLSLEQYLAFFGSNFADGSFDRGIYEEVRDDLRPEARALFDRVYSESDGNPLTNPTYFRQRSFLEVPTDRINPYVKDETAYLKTQTVLRQSPPHFVVSDIQGIGTRVEGKQFDLINLSNVPNYFTKTNGGVEGILAVFRNLAGLLTPGGKLFFYSYSPAIYKDGGPPASSKETIEAIRGLGLFALSLHYMPSIHEKGEDRILVLEKR
jgi:hypothetical protein